MSITSTITSTIDSLLNMKNNKQIQGFTLTYDSRKADVDVKIVPNTSIDKIEIRPLFTDFYDRDRDAEDRDYINGVFYRCHQQCLYEMNDATTRQRMMTLMLQQFQRDQIERRNRINYVVSIQDITNITGYYPIIKFEITYTVLCDNSVKRHIVSE
jgi:rhamnogalacturonyl hydrolase YesR